MATFVWFKSDDLGVESIGFTLINCCLGCKNKDAKNLNSKLAERIGQNSINLFLRKIIDSIKEADNHIGKYSKFKCNSRSENSRPLHTDFQIVSIISSIFFMNYANIALDEDDNVTSISFDLNSIGQNWKKNKDNFKNNVGKIYVMDSLQHRWSNAGDSKLDQIIIGPTYYCRNIEKNDFEIVMDAWFDAMNTERNESKKVASPKSNELLMLAVTYLPIFSANAQLNGSNYDIEHLAPQNAMRKHLDRYSDDDLKLPISSFGNLCLLPEYANRSKKDRTLYSDNDYLNNCADKYSLEDIEKNYSFTKREDLEWIENAGFTADEFKNSYMNFIETHYKNTKKVILDNFAQI